MFYLYFYRHAKAEEQIYQRDFERHLKKKGEKQADIVGKTLKKSNLIPEVIITSNAYRTIETTELTVKKLGAQPIIYKIKNLYNSNEVSYFKEIYKISIKHNQLSDIMIVGHNPTISECVSILTLKEVEMKTATLYILQNESSFLKENFYEQKWEIKKVIVP